MSIDQEVIRLWTVQLLPKYEKLCTDKKLTGDGRQLPRSIQPMYRWFMHQMENRLGIHLKTYPVWAWVAKPDLRSQTCPLWTVGTPKVLIAFDAPKNQVLLSDFEAWNLVYDGGCYLPESLTDRRDYLAYEDWAESLDTDLDPESYAHFEAYREASWERIFDLSWRKELDFLFPNDHKGFRQHVQATVPELRLDQIVSVKHYHC